MMKILGFAVIATFLQSSFLLMNAATATKTKDKFGPEPDVTRDNWIFGPYNRWGFKHMTQLAQVAIGTKGSDYDVSKLPYSSKDYNVEKIKYTARDDPEFYDTGIVIPDSWTDVERTFKEMLERTYTDGIVIMRNGDIIYENYYDGQTENTHHIMWSASKSFAGLMASMLVHEGKLDPEKKVTDYLPVLKDTTAFADATVRQVMDMTTDYQYREIYDDNTAEVVQHMVAGNFRDLDGYTGPGNVRDFLVGLQKVDDKPHGEKFTYRTSNTDLLGWLIDSVHDDKNGYSIDYFSDKIWSNLGQEHDAFIGVDKTHFPLWSGGSGMTTRDAARFGEMLRMRGKNAWGEQVVPTDVVDDIIAGGTDLNVKQFAKSEDGDGAPNMTLEGWAYRNQYWVKPDHIFTHIGTYGQFIWVDTKANLVIAKQSSFPSAVDWIIDDETFQAFYALGKHFTTEDDGCSGIDNKQDCKAATDDSGKRTCKWTATRNNKICIPKP